MTDLITPRASHLAARLCLVALLAAVPAPAFAAGGGGGGGGGGHGGGGGLGGGGLGGGGLGGGSRGGVGGPQGGIGERGNATQGMQLPGDAGARTAGSLGTPDAGSLRGSGNAEGRAVLGGDRGYAGEEGGGFGTERVGGRREGRRFAERELRLRARSRCDRDLAERYNAPNSCNDSTPYGYYP